MNFNYTPGIPNGPNNPSDDQPNMKDNNDSNLAIWNIDHYGFVNPLGGWHKNIRLPQIAGNTDPTAVNPGNGFPANAGQIYTRTINGDLELFYESSAGVVNQLTAAIIPTPGVNGYTFLPGGILVQWGLVNFSTSPLLAGTVLFTIPPNIQFPNAIFNVQATLIGTSTNPQTLQISDTTPPSTTQFVWNFTRAPLGTSYEGFFWFAIGN